MRNVSNRVPICVGLVYATERHGQQIKAVDLNAAVGGTLKGEPLLEIKNENGLVRFADISFCSII